MGRSHLVGAQVDCRQQVRWRGCYDCPEAVHLEVAIELLMSTVSGKVHFYRCDNRMLPAEQSACRLDCCAVSNYGLPRPARSIHLSGMTPLCRRASSECCSCVLRSMVLRHAKAYTLCQHDSRLLSWPDDGTQQSLLHEANLRKT